MYSVGSIYFEIIFKYYFDILLLLTFYFYFFILENLLFIIHYSNTDWITINTIFCYKYMCVLWRTCPNIMQTSIYLVCVLPIYSKSRFWLLTYTMNFISRNHITIILLPVMIEEYICYRFYEKNLVLRVRMLLHYKYGSKLNISFFKYYNKINFN